MRYYTVHLVYLMENRLRCTSRITALNCQRNPLHQTRPRLSNPARDRSLIQRPNSLINTLVSTPKVPPPVPMCNCLLTPNKNHLQSAEVSTNYLTTNLPTIGISIKIDHTCKYPRKKIIALTPPPRRTKLGLD